MNVIHTYWSKPSIQSKGDHSSSWLSEKHHAMSWAFSMLRIKKLGHTIILYTDSAGYDWLINKLGLPYDEVKTELDCLDIPENLWSLAKIWVYSQQKEPFIHIDGDVYIWDDAFFQNIDDLSIVCQHIERGYPYYEEQYHSLLQAKFLLPPEYFPSDPDLFENRALNCGVIGGNAFQLFENLWETSSTLYYKNKEKCRVLTEKYNTLFEQYLIHAIADTLHLKIKPVFTQKMIFNDDFYVEFHSVPFEKKYVHLLTASKRTVRLLKELENRLQYEFPVYFQKIVSIYEAVNDFSDLSEQIINDNIRKIYEYSKMLPNQDRLNTLIYDLLYADKFKIDDFLSNKFLLSEKYHTIELSNRYNGLVDKSIDSLPEENSTDIIPHFICKWNNRIFVEEINNWNNLLCVFEEKTSGLELFEMINELNLICEEDVDRAKELVFTFLISKTIGFQELKIIINNCSHP